MTDQVADLATRSEMIVLGGMMLNKALISEISERVTSASFLQPAHEVLYVDLIAAWAAEEPTDPVATAARLHAAGTLDRVGGTLYLSDLIRSVPTGADAVHHAGLVAEAARERRRWTLHDSLKQALEDGNEQRIAAVAAELGRPDVGPGNRQLVATAAADITMKAPTWLYERRIPAGAITLLGGREGIGKSTISYDLAARTTRGQLPGHYQGAAHAVAIVAGEDDWEAVILPRLVAARADLRRVYRVEARTEDGRYDTVSVPADLDLLAQLAEQRGIVLAVVDPIMSVIHSSLDTHKDREVRQALDPLSRFAATSGVAVLGLIHVNKSNDRDPLNSVMGSRAFAAVARSVLYCLADPEAESEDEYLFGHAKSNLGPKQPTLRYHLAETKIELSDPAAGDPVIVTSRVMWDGVDERSVREAMQGAPTERAPSELTVRLVEWIAAQGRPVPAAEIAAEFSDVKRGTLDKHLARLVERGKLTRPVHGHYTVAHSGTRSGTPQETSEMPEVPEAPDDLVSLAHLADLAPAGMPERVPE